MGQLNDDSPRHAAVQAGAKHLEIAAVDRFVVWQCLCSMIEPVLHELVHRIYLADAILRGATASSAAAIPCDWTEDLPACPNPQKQFWYFYRQGFDNPFLGADHLSLLTWAKGRLPTLELPLPLYILGVAKG